MKEDIDLCTYEKHHKQKITLFLSAMRSYRDVLKKNKIAIDYYELNPDNTDTYGFYQSILKNFPKYNFKKEKVLIFGSGGAARAVTSVFLKEKAFEISIINRNREKAERLRNDLSYKIKTYDWNDY